MARPEAGSDAALLRSVAAGDAGALARLYERHAGPLFGYLYRLAGDRMTAEEILQDTMLAVWRSAGAYEGRSKVSTWLFGVARRQAHEVDGTPSPVRGCVEQRGQSRR
jgi:RNA polymerase sigma factor (sigma-70 family)